MLEAFFRCNNCGSINFEGACAFAFKPPEDADLDFSPPRFAGPPPSLLPAPPESGEGEVTGKNDEVAAVATIMNFYGSFSGRTSSLEMQKKRVWSCVI